MDLAQEDIMRLRALAVWRQLAEEPLTASLGHKGQSGGAAIPADQRILRIGGEALRAGSSSQSLRRNGASHPAMR